MFEHLASSMAGRILVAGRDPDLTQKVGSSLVDDGHQVLFAAHGAEAEEHLEEERFDLIVIDSSLPPAQVQTVLECARRQSPQAVLFLISNDRRQSETLELLRRSALSAAGDREEIFPDSEPPDATPMTLDAVEKAHILRVLRHCRGNKKRAAAMLGINRSSLYGKLKRFGIMVATKVATMTCLLVVALVAVPDARAVTDPHRKIAQGVLDRVAAHLDGGDPSAMVPVIVQTWAAADPDSLAAIDAVEGIRGRIFGSIHGFAAEVAARNVIRLARSPRIKRLSLDWEMTPSMDTAFISTGAYRAVKQDGFNGEGVGVAILDSGVSPGMDMEVHLEIDIVEKDGVAADYFGHGTHMAGIVAGSGEASLCRGCYRTFSGVAPGARIFSVKVLNGHGSGRASDVIAGIDWVLRNHEAHGIRVINVAMGHPVDEPYASDPLCGAVEHAWKSGLVVVASAGNLGAGGHATITAPGNHPSVITVGAAEDWDSIETSDDIVAPFSSMGPTRLDGVLKPDILAPGTTIVSLRSPGSLLDEVLSSQRLRLSEFVDNPPFGDGESPYIALSGTSTATAAVAGAAAILISQDPEATPEDVKVRLLVGALKINESIVARGAGLLDIGAALDLGTAGVSAAVAPSPRVRVVYDGDGIEKAAFEEIGSAWGEPGAWPSELIWGAQESWGISTEWIDLDVWLEPESSGNDLMWLHPDEGGLVIWGFR